MITLIETIEQVKNKVFVRAVIEDMVLLYHQTNIDPPEYGSALCETSFELNSDEFLPKDEKDLIKYLDNLCLNWEVTRNDWD
jgi:hypothetical protein